MKKFKAAIKAVVSSPRFKEDALDILKVIVGVVAAKYGIKLA